LPTIILDKYDIPGKLRSFFKKFAEIQFRIFCRILAKPLEPKIRNAQKCNMKLVGGVLKEAIPVYVLFIPSFQVLSGENSQKRRSYGISGNPRRVGQFLQMCERNDGKCLCNEIFKTYALIPC
jgi:hypothetical protein